MKALIKLMSIVLIVIGSIELITMFFIFAGLNFGIVAEFSSIYGSASSLSLILETAGCILTIICGILGCLHNKHPKLKKVCPILGLVFAICTAIDIVMNITVFHLITIPNTLGMSLDIVLVLIYVWAFHKLKQEEV